MTHMFKPAAAGSIQQRDGAAVGQFGDYTLRSRYQAVISPALLRTVGMEALLRVERDGVAVPASQLMAGLSPAERAAVDRMVFSLHCLNVPPTPESNEWVFLPVRAETIHQEWASVPEAVAQISGLNVDTTRLVLEVTDNAGLSERSLGDFVREYRAAGFRIAINHFGVGSSNFDRVLAIKPDMVKLDSHLIVNTGASPRARRLFPHMVALLRETATLVVVTGVSTEEQAQLAVYSDAELLQGDWFARADQRLPATADIRQRAEKLMTLANSSPPRSEIRMRGRFMAVWNAYREGRTLEDIVRDIPEEEVTRVYCIDARGYQIGDTALTPQARKHGIKHPLSDARGACWARRQYFRNAIEQPGRVQISRPYLSLTEQRLCMTYSCVVTGSGPNQIVLCMDAVVEE
jgi:EAL domain-containing protein (putative c-di-GMP-specific phosphodiesterase class I)